MIGGESVTLPRSRIRSCGSSLNQPWEPLSPSNDGCGNGLWPTILADGAWREVLKHEAWSMKEAPGKEMPWPSIEPRGSTCVAAILPPTQDTASMKEHSIYPWVGAGSIGCWIPALEPTRSLNFPFIVTDFLHSRNKKKSGFPCFAAKPIHSVQAWTIN